MQFSFSVFASNENWDRDLKKMLRSPFFEWDHPANYVSLYADDAVPDCNNVSKITGYRQKVQSLAGKALDALKGLFPRIV